MTAQQIVDREILYEQSYVLNELIRVNDSLWDKIENTNELDEVYEWWLVTPYLAELLKGNGEVILADYDCYWWGRTTSRRRDNGKHLPEYPIRFLNFWRLGWRFPFIYKDTYKIQKTKLCVNIDFQLILAEI